MKKLILLLALGAFSCSTQKVVEPTTVLKSERLYRFKVVDKDGTITHTRIHSVNL